MSSSDLYYNPVETHCGLNKLQDLSDILDSLHCKTDHVLLMTRGADFYGSEEEKTILDQLKSRQVARFDLTISNPDVTDLYDIIQETNKYNYDIILAVGGGSILDLSKSICALKHLNIENVENLRAIITEKKYILNEHKANWIGVPTTAGTGSEVTRWATIWDNEKELKYSIDAKDIFAKAAIIDPKLTINLPLRLTVSSALDAVCHATESYWSKNTNAISRLFAIAAIKHIINDIEKLIDEPQNENYRAQIAYGSFYAGMAFSNTATTACHALSYPITLMFGVDHGIAVSMTLAKMLELNEEYLVEKETLLEAFGVRSCQEVDAVIKNIYTKAGLSPRLQDYGVEKNHFETIVDHALHNGRMENNPGSVTKEQLMNVLYRIF